MRKVYTRIKTISLSGKQFSKNKRTGSKLCQDTGSSLRNIFKGHTNNSIMEEEALLALT